MASKGVPIVRWRAWMMLSVLALMLPLGACAPAEAPKAAPPAAPAKPAPKYGGILAYVGTSAMENLHPFKIADASVGRGLGPIYEQLLSFQYDLGPKYRIDYKVVPWLAESWEQPNATTYIFRLRKGVKWHDGEELTAADVVFTYEYLRDPKNGFPKRSNLALADTIEATDGYTVRITLKQPSPVFLQLLVDTYYMPILPKHIFDQGQDFSKVAIGTGAFKLKSFDPRAASIFAKNEDYWQKGKPYPDGVQVIYGLDESGRMAAFKAKQTDLIEMPDKPQVEALLKIMPEAKYEKFISDYGNSLVMQLGKPPFSDVRVRRAIHLGIDRQALIKIATFGDGVINPPGMPGHKEGWAIPQEELLKMPGYRQPKDADIAEAKRLLAEAGYPEGFKASTVYPRQFYTTPRIIEPLVGQLKAIGVELVLEGKMTPEYRKAESEGSYETQMAFTADMDLAKRQYDYFHSKGAYNKFGLKDPQLEELIEIQRGSLDVKEQKRAALEMQRLLLDKLYVIPTVELPSYQMWQPWVNDYVYHIGTSVIVYQDTVTTIWLDADQMPKR